MAKPTRSVREGVALSVVVLAVGSFSVIGASANAPLLSAALGLTAVGVGAIASVAYLGAMLSARLAGNLTDRAGPSSVIIAGLVAMAAGDGLAVMASRAPLFYVGVFTLGLGYGMINPSTTVVSNPRGAHHRALVLSIKQSGVPLGGIVAGAALPSVAAANGWRAAFGVCLVTCGVVALAVWLRGGYRAQPWEPMPMTSRGGRRLTLPFGYLYGLFIAATQVGIFAFTAAYLVQSRGLSGARAGLGVSLLLVGGVFGRLFWGWVSDTRPHHRVGVLQATATVGALSLGGLIVAPVALLPALLLCVGMSSVGWNGVYIAAVAEASPTDRIGAVTGTSLTLINLGAILGPLLVGGVVHVTSSWTSGLLMLVALSVGAALVSLVFTAPGPPAGAF